MANFYNLSSQNSLNCNKELIFVKLTDSALRAIEEYQKNQVSIVSKPFKIDFLYCCRVPGFTKNVKIKFKISIRKRFY